MPEATKGSERRAPEVDLRRHGLLQHRLRYEIFMILCERAASSAELVDILGARRQRISDQIKELVDFDLVELVAKEPGPRGGLRHLYRAVNRYVFDADEWGALTVSTKNVGSEAVVRILHGQVVRALECGSFDEDENRVHIRLPFWGDRQAMVEVDEIMCRALEEIEGVAELSHKRQQTSDEPPRRIITAMQSFLAAPADH
jgi:predicted transcriptional regulator